MCWTDVYCAVSHCFLAPCAISVSNSFFKRSLHCVDDANGEWPSTRTSLKSRQFARRVSLGLLYTQCLCYKDTKPTWGLDQGQGFSPDVVDELHCTKDLLCTRSFWRRSARSVRAPQYLSVVSLKLEPFSLSSERSSFPGTGLQLLESSSLGPTFHLAINSGC